VLDRSRIPCSVLGPESERAIEGIKGIGPNMLRNWVMDVTIFTRPPRTIVINVGTTPTLLLKPPHSWPYLIYNPSLAVGLTTSVTVASGTVNSNGNSQASPIGVAGHSDVHFHLNVTSITGTWDIYAQSKDPVSGNWADSQNIFTNITSVDTYYAHVGKFGIATDLAVRWDMISAGSMTFTLSGTLKDGIGGSTSGVSRGIYIGGRDVTVNSGIPIFEGENLPVLLGQDIELWAISQVANLPVRVFEL
jgi:hypothetical protein